MDRKVELGTVISPAKTIRCGKDSYPVLSMTMHNGLVFQDEKFKKVIASKDTSDYKVVYRNQLVISFPIDEGVLAAQRITDAGIVSPAYGIWNIDQTQVLPEFLEYALRCDRAIQYYKAKLRGSTARRRSLPTPTLLAFTIPMPTIEEQIKVLDIIHKLNLIIENRKNQIVQYDNLIKARFVELFGDPELNNLGWMEAKIGDNCFVTKLAGFEYTKYIHYEDSGDVVMVKAQNVKNGSLNRKDLSYISNDVSDSLPRSQLAPGDVVMTYVGANIGDVAIIDDEYKYHLAPNVAKIRPDTDKYNSVFFMYMLMMKTDYIISNSADTAKAALGMERIRNLNVFVPDLVLQNEFERFVKQVDKSKFVVQKSLEETQLLFANLMQEYFG